MKTQQHNLRRGGTILPRWAAALSAFTGFICFFLGRAHADVPKNWQIWYQNAATPVMERIEQMHIILLYVIFGIAIFVTALLVYTTIRFREKNNKVPSKRTHNVPLEITWTLIPLAIVVGIMIPSVKLIFYMDKVEDADMTVKVIGYQWNWKYVYPDHKVEFFSNMLKKDQIKPGMLRNLEVDEPVVVPVNTNVRLLVTSADVIHSWAVPAFGVKADCVPGRLRETWIRVKKPGTYYGQCSEICGHGHGFMSIAVRAVPLPEYHAWVMQKGGRLITPEESREAAASEGAPGAQEAAQEEAEGEGRERPKDSSTQEAPQASGSRNSKTSADE